MYNNKSKKKSQFRLSWLHTYCAIKGPWWWLTINPTPVIKKSIAYV